MKVLVPIAILEGETVPPGLMHLLRTADVTILGYHELPEQTPPDQARLQYEERANAALEDLCEEFRRIGGTADHHLVFTHDDEQTIRRVAGEIDASAFVIPGVTGDVEQLLVALSGDVPLDRILAFVVELVDDREIGVTVFSAAADRETGAPRLDEAASRLRNAGLDVQSEFRETRTPRRALIDVLPGYDAIVLGEQAPSLRSLVFGDEAERVASESIGPVLVVRRVDE